LKQCEKEGKKKGAQGNELGEQKEIEKIGGTTKGAAKQRGRGSRVERSQKNQIVAESYTGRGYEKKQNRSYPTKGERVYNNWGRRVLETSLKRNNQ